MLAASLAIQFAALKDSVSASVRFFTVFVTPSTPFSICSRNGAKRLLILLRVSCVDATSCWTVPAMMGDKLAGKAETFEIRLVNELSSWLKPLFNNPTAGETIMLARLPIVEIA